MMFIIVKDRKKLIPKILNQEDGFTYKGISIYPNNNYHYLYLSNGYCLDDGRKSCRLHTGIYRIDTDETYYQLQLYVYGDDEGYKEYSFYQNIDPLVIGTGKADIASTDANLLDGTLSISGGIISGDLEFSVNGKKYDGFPLNEGDLIECLGLRIFYYEKFLYINHFMNKVFLKVYEPFSQKITYPSKKMKIHSVISHHPIELAIPEIKPYEAKETEGNKDILRTILPNSIMSASIVAVSALSLYNGYLNGNPLSSMLSYLITPAAMVTTGVFLPLFFYFKEKKSEETMISENRNSYLEYLEGYGKTIEEKVDLYLKDEGERFFSKEYLQKEPFYLKKKDPDFLCLCLGQIHREEDFFFEKKDLKIDEAMSEIKRKLSYIGPLPLILDLKEHKKVTITSKRSERSYFFMHFLLELSYRHSYEDLSIAVFSKNSDLISDFYDLPHLFLNGRRLFIDDERMLQELDLQKLDHPLVLFMDEKSDLQFSNPQICAIYFSCDQSDLYKESDCIVEYLNQSGTLYDGEKKTFQYVKKLDDFSRYFRKMGAYNPIFSSKENITFRKIFPEEGIRDSYLKKHHDLRCDFAMQEDRLLYFDLHEKKQGPHGLIGGSTGSGKSELIISMLLSLCIRYSPEYLNLVVIDYKGGGISESLTYNGKMVPHIIASLSNLENGKLNRLIIALKNECIQRQRSFRSLSEKCGIGIMDLDEYRDNEPERYGLHKIAHLLIIVDEFAELKKENPEAIRELISISRIGRSLGVHLILATQKPSGNIDDEIFSNSRFKIALKVFEERDSIDIIRNKDAAFLSQAGSFILKVDESLIRAQSIYAKNDASGKEPYEVSLLDSSLKTIKKKTVTFEKGITENRFFVSKILDVCKELKIKTEKLDFLPPEPMERKKLVKGKCFVFGEADDYLNNIRKAVAYSLTENILICSNRKNEMNGFLNTLDENNRQCVLISHRHFENSVISDTLHYSQNKDIGFLFQRLCEKDLPVTLMIEDLSAFLSYDESYQDILIRLLKRSENMNFNIVALAPSVQLSFKMISAFKRKILIGFTDKNDISYLFGSRSVYQGNSFYCDEEVICFVPVLIENFIPSLRKTEQIVIPIPDTIQAKEENGRSLLGFDMENREYVYTQNKILVTSFDEEALDIYRKAYGDALNIMTYDPKISSINSDEFLWIGSGIFSQRLFISSYRDDLSEEEAVYYHHGRKRLLKRVDHV